MTNSSKPQGFNTLAVHAGQIVEEPNLSRGVPVHRTSSYVFKDAKHASDLFGLRQLGNIYTRLMNPTTDILEKRMAALEGGVGALATASGTAAIFYSIINIAENGHEVISSRNLYGGTYTMFNDILPKFGIKIVFADYDNPDSFKSAVNSNTRAIFLESIGNPRLGIPDFERIAAIADEYHLPLIVDSTFTTPYLFRPIDHGASIVAHSLTKWIGGHGTGVGGIVIDSGKFDWNDPKFKMFVDPEPSYHGLRFSQDLGPLQEMAYILRMRLVALRNLGACISPDNAWMFLQGLETLSLRMERHCENSIQVARYLSEHGRVRWVRYPGLDCDPSFEMAQRYFRRGMSGGVVVFGLDGTSQMAEKFIDNLKLFSHLANVGDAKSLVIHPASTTHSQLTQQQREEAGIPDELIRLSVGIEDIEDIVDDMENAFASL